MEPGPLAELAIATGREAGGLLEVARASIRHGVWSGRPLEVDAESGPASWLELRAAFVTLRSPGGALRGCVGSLEASRPLAATVAWNAFRAAFEDPRFAPLGAEEVEGVRIHISVLSSLEKIPASDEADLLVALRRGVDGLLIRDGVHAATFLPSVWEQLPDPLRFVRALQAKAGLPAGHWSGETRAFRYTAETLDED